MHDVGMNHNTAVFHKRVLAMIELYFFKLCTSVIICHSDLVLSCSCRHYRRDLFLYERAVQCSIDTEARI